MKKLLYIFTFFAMVGFANEIDEVDCLVIQEENSIICKYMNDKTTEERFINFEWTNPAGDVSRNRKIFLPLGHRSIYDFRYLSGRMPGVWTVKVLDNGLTYSTTFEIAQ